MKFKKNFQSLSAWLKRSWFFLLVAAVSCGSIIALNGHAIAQKLDLPNPSPTPKVEEVGPLKPGTGAEALKQGTQVSTRVLTKYGHYPYTQANPTSLLLVGKYGSRPEKLSPEAADAWKKMVAAARKEGAYLVPISAFRSLETQTWLFRDRARRRGSEAAAARSVAPPGFSEHHTGYAIDVGDGRIPGADISQSFANTKAYRWMNKHAKEYGFELSFPQGNKQNVIYEPWHWRYVGTPNAEQIFAVARGRS